MLSLALAVAQFPVFTQEAAAEPPHLFLRGDANGDGQVDISDAIRTLGWLFTGGETPPCLDAADTNDDSQVDISDPIAVLSFLFTGGVEPAKPGPHVPGVDPTDDTLSCDVSLVLSTVVGTVARQDAASPLPAHA